MSAELEASARQRKTAIGMALVLFVQLMLVLDSTIVNVALPHIADDLHFGPAALAWVLDGYMLAFGGLLLLGGRLGDVFGRLRVFWIGLAVFAFFSLLGGLAVDPTMLVICRALQGAGAALCAPSVLALLTTNAPTPAARNRALAAFTAVSSGGAAIGMVLGGVLTDALSWRWTMFVNVPIGIAILATVRRFVIETPRRPGRFDFVGAIAATGGAVSIVWAVVEAPTDGWVSWQTIGGLALGAALLVVLVVTETRVAHPLLRLTLLRSHTRVASLISMASCYGTVLGAFFLLVQYLEDYLGYRPIEAGLAFLPMPVCVFATSRVLPILVTRLGEVALIVIGSSGMILATLHLTQLNANSSYWDGAFPSLSILGCATALCMMPITSLGLKGVEPEHAGAASGLVQTMQQLGGSIGLAIIASVFAAHAVPGDFLQGARAGFVAVVILPSIALISMLSVAVRRLPYFASAPAGA